MTIQSLVSGIFHGIYENAFRFLQCNENGHDGEKFHQTILWSLAVIKLLPMKLKSYVLLFDAPLFTYCKNSDIIL
ncbi:MAG: hypothetical protein ACLFVR_16360 [Thiohalospira sp.]